MTLSRSQLQTESPWPHRLAVLLCCATFPLIWAGGLVTSHDAGMAVHDWPSTFGYNLFLYPWKTWLFGPFDIFVEHGHRQLGAVVGLIAIGLVVAVMLFDRRRWMKLAAWGALALVIVQGVIGGQRVLLNDRQLAQLHGCIGPLFFAFAVALAVMTSSLWRNHRPAAADAGDRRLMRFGWITAALVYLQLVLGSFLRHSLAGATRDQFRMWVMFHLAMAVVVTGHLLVWAWRSARHQRQRAAFVWPSRALAVLIVGQLALGAATWIVNYGWPVWFQQFAFAAGYRIEAQGMLQSLVVTGHVATGSLLLAFSSMLATRQSRLLTPVQPGRAPAASRLSCRGVLA